MITEPLAALREAFVRCRDMDAPLAERLEAYSDAAKELIPAYAEAIDRLVARLSGADAATPGEGDTMPSFADDLVATALEGSTLKERTRLLRGKVLLFLDTCFAGQVIGAGRRGLADMNTVVNELASAENGVSPSPPRPAAKCRRRIRPGAMAPSRRL